MATIPQPSEPQPAWDVALLFPSQGDWYESDYLALHTNQLVELSDGNLEVLPMPTPSHQAIVRFLYELLSRFVAAGSLGTVYFAPLRLRIRDKTFREPDVIFLSGEHLAHIGKKFLTGADLVIEVVSPDADARERDYDRKRNDYSELSIPEYWIIDPQIERITVLKLNNGTYAVHGEFAIGDLATSHLISGFSVDTAAVFEVGRNPS